MANIKLIHNTTPQFFFWKELNRLQNKILNLEYRKDVSGTLTPTPFFESGKATVFAVTFESREQERNMITYDFDTNQHNYQNVYPPQASLAAYAFFTIGQIQTVEAGLSRIETSLYFVLDSSFFKINPSKLEPGFTNLVLSQILPGKPNGSIRNVSAYSGKQALQPISQAAEAYKFYYLPYVPIRFDFDMFVFYDESCGITLDQDSNFC